MTDPVAPEEVPGAQAPGAEVADEQPEDPREPVDVAQAAGEPEEDLQAALDQSEAERASLFDQLQRARADYDNLNKRKTRELMTALDRGAATLVRDLLAVLDNFDYALQAAKSSEDTQLAKGVALVHEQLLNVLTESGLEPVPGAGEPFDPAHHEAVVHDEGEGEGELLVTEVLRPGWRFRGQLLRPAAVKVGQ